MLIPASGPLHSLFPPPGLFILQIFTEFTSVSVVCLTTAHESCRCTSLPVMSCRELEISRGESVYTMEIGKLYRSRLALFLFFVREGCYMCFPFVRGLFTSTLLAGSFLSLSGQLKWHYFRECLAAASAAKRPRPSPLFVSLPLFMVVAAF